MTRLSPSGLARRRLRLDRNSRGRKQSATSYNEQSSRLKAGGSISAELSDMPYASDLESRIAKKATKAITEFGLIEHGDRIMVGLSGGKDSWALIQVLDVLKRRAPIDFSFVAVNIDSGYDGFEHHKITDTCAARGWELHVEHTDIGETIEDI